MGLSIRGAHEVRVARMAMSLGVLAGCFALALVAGGILMIPSGSDAVEGDLVAVDATNAVLSVGVDALVERVDVDAGDVGAEVVTNSSGGYRMFVGDVDDADRVVLTVVANY